MKILVFLVWICLNFYSSHAAIGLDTITPMSIDDFNCFRKLNFTFYIGEVYTMNGTFREVSIQNMKNAIAGLKCYIHSKFPFFSRLDRH